MNDQVWLGNSIVPRWEAFLLLGGVGAVALIGLLIAIVLIGVMISWLVNPTVKPGKQ